MNDFTDQRVLITGAAGALGQAVTAAFDAAGARMILVDRATDRLQGLYDDRRRAGRAVLLAADLTDETSVAAMAEQAVAAWGGVDVLANIAGGFAMGTRVHETPLETWEFMLNLNARSVFLTCRAILPQMLKQGRGKIVNVAARAALEGKAKMAPYCISKAAVIRLTESLAAEYRNDGINVNCILPGTIDTPRNREDMPDADHSKWVPPAALADVILFLASDAARGVHGAAVPVYGLS